MAAGLTSVQLYLNAVQLRDAMGHLEKAKVQLTRTWGGTVLYFALEWETEGFFFG